jgi:hypothetical protein
MLRMGYLVRTQCNQQCGRTCAQFITWVHKDNFLWNTDMVWHRTRQHWLTDWFASYRWRKTIQPIPSHTPIPSEKKSVCYRTLPIYRWFRTFFKNYYVSTMMNFHSYVTLLVGEHIKETMSISWYIMIIEDLGVQWHHSNGIMKESKVNHIGRPCHAARGRVRER